MASKKKDIISYLISKGYSEDIAKDAWSHTDRFVDRDVAGKRIFEQVAEGIAVGIDPKNYNKDNYTEYVGAIQQATTQAEDVALQQMGTTRADMEEAQGLGINTQQAGWIEELGSRKMEQEAAKYEEEVLEAFEGRIAPEDMTMFTTFLREMDPLSAFQAVQEIKTGGAAGDPSPWEQQYMAAQLGPQDWIKRWGLEQGPEAGAPPTPAWLAKLTGGEAGQTIQQGAKPATLSAQDWSQLGSEERQGLKGYLQWQEGTSPEKYMRRAKKLAPPGGTQSWEPFRWQ